LVVIQVSNVLIPDEDDDEYEYEESRDVVFTYVSIGDSDAVRIGETVFTIGSPLGYHNTFSDGMISRFSDVAEFGIYRVYGMIQFTAPISGGSSGGALLNSAGEVIGITTAGYGGAFAQALNFAVPIARVDLTSTESGVYSSLPIGETYYISDSVLAGTWLWGGGYYTFNEDGTGNRTWAGDRAAFEWHISEAVLLLTFPDSDRDDEQWGISIINEDAVIIGGSLFTRGEPVIGVEFSLLVGTWNWGGGWYAFTADGIGNRVWNGISATFQWAVVNDTLVISLIPEGTEEHWHINVINDDEIYIGGSFFLRTSM
jgi:hypothetical protein